VERRSGLGKGLGALIPGDLTGVGDGDGTGVREVPVSQIEPNRYQPRDHFDEEALTGLTASIRELGVLQPLLVRRQDGADGYELIAGERRWRASKRAGLQFVPVIVREVDDSLSLQQALVENLHREDLNPMEEAAACQQLIDDFSLTQEEVAQRVGKSRSAVTNLLRLFQLPAQVQGLVADGKVSAGHAKVLLGVPGREAQENLALTVADEGLTVRALEDLVRKPVEVPEEDEPEVDEPTAAPRTPKLRPPGLLELEDLLSGQLDTRVRIDMGPKRGKVTIEFADLEDLERIYKAMNHGRPE
jgi:ParB family transcriptional regulator, chromosome partitioning protein